MMTIVQAGIMFNALGGLIIAFAALRYEKDKNMFRWGTVVGAFFIYYGLLPQLPWHIVLSVLVGTVIAAITVLFGLLLKTKKS